MDISVTQHQKNLRTLPCIVTEMTPVTLHHCHGGSMKLRGWHVGVAQKQNPWLQIPLHESLHTGSHGIDSGMGVETWEKRFGSQWGYLEEVRELLGYDIFRMAQMFEGLKA